MKQRHLEATLNHTDEHPGHWSKGKQGYLKESRKHDGLVFTFDSGDEAS